MAPRDKSVQVHDSTVAVRRAICPACGARGWLPPSCRSCGRFELTLLSGGGAEPTSWPCPQHEPRRGLIPVSIGIGRLATWCADGAHLVAPSHVTDTEWQAISARLAEIVMEEGPRSYEVCLDCRSPMAPGAVWCEACGGPEPRDG